MSPMIERVTHRVRHSLGPLLELLPIRRITRAETLLDAICSHGTPLIVVTIEPYLGKVTETVVRSHILRIEVTVVVDNGHLRRMVVIQTLGRRALQQEIGVVKLFHSYDIRRLILSKYNNLHAKNQLSLQLAQIRRKVFPFFSILFCIFV